MTDEPKKRQPSRPLRALEAAIRLGQAEYLGRKFRPHSVWSQDCHWRFMGTEVPLRPWEHRALVRKLGEAARAALRRSETIMTLHEREPAYPEET